MSWNTKNCCCGKDVGGEVINSISSIICNDTERQLIHFDGETETTRVEIYYTDVIWAEESSQLSAPPNGLEWSFGDGATGPIGLPVWEDMEAVGMVAHYETGNGSATVELYINGVDSGGSVIMNNGLNPSVSTFAPKPLSTGDLIGFHTTNVSGPPANSIRNARVGVILRRKAEIVCV